jgi:hypothetical protein
MAGHPSGLVVRVIFGHGVLLVRGGSVTMLVMMPVGVVVVDVVVGRGGHLRVLVLVAAQGRALVRNSISHPWYGHSASQGAMSVAVGTVDGHPHGLRIVLRKAQSLSGHSLRHPRFWIVRVAVGHDAGGSCASARLTRLSRAATTAFMLFGFWLACCGALR